MTKSSMVVECTSVRPSSTAELMRRYDATYIARWREFMATPEATGSRHWASICTVLPRRTTGFACRKKMMKKHHTCRPFRWPWQCAGTIPSTSPNGGGPGLLRKPLVAATGRVLRPIEWIGHAKADFFRVFSLSTRWKGGSGDVKTPNNNRGMTYQNEGKDLGNAMWYLVGVVKLADKLYNNWFLLSIISVESTKNIAPSDTLKITENKDK